MSGSGVSAVSVPTVKRTSKVVEVQTRKAMEVLRCPPGPGAPALTAALFFNQLLKVQEDSTFPPPRRCLWGLGCPASTSEQGTQGALWVQASQWELG